MRGEEKERVALAGTGVAGVREGWTRREGFGGVQGGLGRLPQARVDVDVCGDLRDVARVCHTGENVRGEAERRRGGNARLRIDCGATTF